MKYLAAIMLLVSLTIAEAQTDKQKQQQELIAQIIAKFKGVQDDNISLNQKLGSANAWLASAQAETGVLKKSIKEIEDKNTELQDELDVIKPKYENLSANVNKAGVFVAGIIAIFVGYTLFKNATFAAFFTGGASYGAAFLGSVATFSIVFAAWSYIFRHQ